MAAERAPVSFRPRANPRARRLGRLIPRAPPPPVAGGIAAVLALLSGVLLYGTDLRLDLLSAILVFLLPALVAGALTGPVAAALGGRFSPGRSFLLADLGLLLGVPFLLGGAVLTLVGLGSHLPAPEWIVLVALAPSLWFRHLSLYGVSNPTHGRTLPGALLQPVAALVGLAVLVPPTAAWLVGAAVILLVAFLCSAFVLRAADRPLRREFGVSGVALIRPLLEHVAARDPGATRQLEEFFGRHAIRADLRVTLLGFRRPDGRTLATVALPSAHPGPFGAIGASDLPRKIAETLGPSAGTVFVPHTPCNHDLDLPSEQELDRVRQALVRVQQGLVVAPLRRASPLVSPRPGSLARAQLLGETVLVLISQAPEPSDDIDYAVVDPMYAWEFNGARPLLALVDAHNSYRGDEGDLTYGSPVHRQLSLDVRAAVEAALAAGESGPVRVGVAARTGYSVAEHGIGPEGIRAMVVEVAGRTTAYVLIDGNNLLYGLRARLLEGLRDRVDDAEILTTDNHVVHEVDGGINAVGERLSLEQLLGEARAVVDGALADLGEVQFGAATAPVPEVRVLGPGWTARLLTSLGDTLSAFAHTAFTSFLLLVACTFLVVAVLR